MPVLRSWYQYCFVMRWTSLSVMVLMQTELLGSVFIAALPEFHLYPLSGSANTTFTIGGTDYLNSSRIRFRYEHFLPSRIQHRYFRRRVGKQIFLPKRFEKVGYESTVAFSVSAFGSSFSSVEVTRNGRDFFFTGTLFQCGRRTPLRLLLLFKFSSNLLKCM